MSTILSEKKTLSPWAKGGIGLGAGALLLVLVGLLFPTAVAFFPLVSLWCSCVLFYGALWVLHTAGVELDFFHRAAIIAFWAGAVLYFYWALGRRQFIYAWDYVNYIQKQFNKSIAELKEGMDQHQKQLEKIEEDIISRERSKLRDRLLQSHRYFTSPEKNPLHAWSEMEADAFWSMFKEYENAKGNGHMHTVVQPEMRALEVIPMHEDAKIAELMGSRK